MRMTKLIVALLCLISISAQAGKLNSGDYRFREDVEEFITTVAAKSDYSEKELLALFSQVKHQRHLFERMDKPAEKLEWHQYRRIFLTDKRVSKGIEFWKKHRDLLQKVERKYQVPAEIIVAIVGVETFYGAYHGKSPVFDTLVTFAFDYPKRAAFFTKELEQFLILAKEQNLDIRGVKGSYAGAMGMPQFISSSYRSYAIDFDGDGQANLFDSLPDVLGSVANYFSRHGWKVGQAITYPLAISNKATAALLKSKSLTPGMKPAYSWDELKSAGLSTKADLNDELKVALLKFQQKSSSEYWVGLQNFYVITRYNHSNLYAMAVYQLSEKLKKGVN